MRRISRIGFWIFVLGVVWGFWRPVLHKEVSKQVGFISPVLHQSQSAIFCSAETDNIFMGFGPRTRSSDVADEPKIEQSDEIPALPAPVDVSNDDKRELKVGGPSVAMDELGPIIVNTDGTLRRIENWAQLTKAEQLNTLRIVARRNKQRLEALRELEAEENGHSSAEKASDSGTEHS